MSQILAMGSNKIYNKNKCKNNNRFKNLDTILNNIKIILTKLNINVIQPIETINNDICRSLWMRDNFINIDNNLYLLTMSDSKRNPNSELKPLYLNEHPIHNIVDNDKILKNIYVDGGDIIQYNDNIFIGIGMRTNNKAYKWFKNKFKNKNVFKINHKALHLDCCFCMLKNNVIIYSKKYIKKFPSKLKNKYRVFYVEDYIKKNTDPNLATNILIINNYIIVADLNKFNKFYDFLSTFGYKIIKIPFYNLWKDGGGIRCLTQWIQVNDQKIL
tara:strand:+ start:5834 stop:6649 length:816 start_codon:yes stop_codon:yes gene_type:complete